MQVKEKLLSNTVYLFFDWAFLTLFSFVFWVILGKTLAVSDYGIVATSINFVIIISLFSLFGITGALNKLIPEFIEKKELGKVYSLIKLSLKIALVSLFIVVSFLIVFSNFISNLLKIPHNAFIIAIVSIISYNLFVLFGTFLYGFQNMRKFFLTNLFMVLLKVLGSFILIIIGLRFYGPLIAFGLSYLIVSFLRIDLKYFKRTITIPIKTLLSYSLPFFVSSIALSLITYSQYIILTIIKNPEITGIFAVAFVLTNLISIIPSVLILASFPIISGLSIHQETKKKQGYIIGLILRYALFLTIPLSIIFLLFSRFIVLSFSRVDYLAATNFFPILIPAAVLFGIGNIFLYNIYAIGKPKIYRNITVISSVLFLSLAIILTTYFSAFGLSLSYFVTTLFFFVVSFYFIRKFLKITFFIKDIFKIIFSSVIMTLLIFLILKQFVFNFPSFMIFSLISLLLFSTICYLIRFFRKEDIEILLYLKEKLPLHLRIVLNGIINVLSRRIQK